MRIKFFSVLATILLCAAGVAPAHGDAPRISGIEPEDMANPASRAATWLGAFDEFVREHPELTPDQRAAVNEAVHVAAPDLFVDRPSAEQKAELYRVLQELRGTLPFATYADLLSELNELRPWLVQQQVLAGGTCTCYSDSQCADGYSCESVSCTSEEGSLNNGVCQEDGIWLE